MEFFNTKEIKSSSSIAGKKYRKGVDLDIEAIGKKYFKPVIEKTEYWAEQICPEGWEVEPGKKWQVMGYAMKYSWARIYKKGDRKYGVYFTVGVHLPEHELVWKLDCQRKVPNREAKNKIVLSKSQIEQFDEIVNGSGADWSTLSPNDIKDMSWNELVSTTKDFIKEFEYLYDRAISVMHGKQRLQTTRNGSPETEPPSRSAISEKRKRYKYKFKKHFRRANPEQLKLIGDAGERFILKLERRKLKQERIPNKVKHISKEQGDGAGYDILSYDKRGKKMFIEVKTTIGVAEKEFYLSRNEYKYSKDNASNYYIYRVYDFDLKTKVGKYFVQKGFVEDNFNVKASEYVVVR